jgi:iron(III) transport system permease protein
VQAHIIKAKGSFFFILLAGLVCLPLWGLLRVAFEGNTASLQHLLATVLPEYLLNTLLLAAGSVFGALCLGTGAAWFVERYSFKGRDTLAWALILPLAMPVYVIAYAFTDALQFAGPAQTWLRGLMHWRKGDYWFPEVRSLPGAMLIFSAVLYPYVYLLARDAFASQSAVLIDAARSMGMSARWAFWRVVLPGARPALVGGSLLVLMETMADYGAVTYLGVDTLSSGIFRTWFGLADKSGAAQLAVFLLAIVAVVMWLERRNRGAAKFAQAARKAPRIALKGKQAALVFGLCALPLLLGFVLPIALLIRLIALETETLLSPQLGMAIVRSLEVAGLAVILCVGVALYLAMHNRLKRVALLQWASRLLSLGYAAPGAVLAIALLWVMGLLDQTLAASSSKLLFTGSLFALLYAYLIRFFAVSHNSIEAGLARIPSHIDDAAQLMGVRGKQAVRLIFRPLLKRSVLSASLLVFIDVMKELPATLSLRPFNFDTLATQIYQFTRDERLAEAAIPSLVLVVLCSLGLRVLSRLQQQTV